MPRAWRKTESAVPWASKPAKALVRVHVSCMAARSARTPGGNTLSSTSETCAAHPNMSSTDVVVGPTTILEHVTGLGAAAGGASGNRTCTVSDDSNDSIVFSDCGCGRCCCEVPEGSTW
eukprot:7759009-Alexandrium_andersonii.AAC.1